jgi:uncharacterized protein (DUF4415 family)
MKPKFDPAIHDDNPSLTDAFMEGMRPAKVRGRPKLENPKDTVKLRVDHDVVEHFKAGGPGWQSRMNEALRAAMEGANA